MEANQHRTVCAAGGFLEQESPTAFGGIGEKRERRNTGKGMRCCEFARVPARLAMPISVSMMGDAGRALPIPRTLWTLQGVPQHVDARIQLFVERMDTRGTL